MTVCPPVCVIQCRTVLSGTPFSLVSCPSASIPAPTTYGACGAPCFASYDGDAKADSEAFFRGSDGHRWFDTGDLGHLDADGYLFITGRSKEVINRGGEIVSPFEVEEAIMACVLG